MHLLWSTITVHAIYTCSGISGGYILALMKKNILQQIKEMERDIIFRPGKLSLAQQTIMHLDCWAPIVQVNRALLARPALHHYSIMHSPNPS
jgi:hypothetical protein